MPKKTRLDVFLTEQGNFISRERAQAAIMAGSVYINNQKALKSGTIVQENDIVDIRSEKEKYVSRGGYKLEKAILAFNLNLQNLTACDIGASTGGFSDCMLQNGAKKSLCY